MAETVGRTRTHDASGFADDWGRLRSLLSRRGARRLGIDIYEGFAANDVLTYSSAISFRVLFALVPLLLAGVAVLGFFDFEEVYREQVAPELLSRVSTGAYAVVNATVEEVLSGGSGFWLTLGVGLAVWEVSGAIRAVMGSLNLIYGTPESRSTPKRIGISIVLAIATTIALGLAIVALQLGPEIANRIGLTSGVAIFFARWVGAILLMTGVVVMLIRFAPARHQRRSLISVSAVLVTAAWIVTTLLFDWYATTVASYKSLFGNLSIVIVLMTYLYVSVLTFLLGVQVDALLRGYARGSNPSGRRRAEASRAS